MKKLLIAFLLFAAVISASIIKPVERFATENNKVRLSRITVDSARLEEYNAYLKEEIERLIFRNIKKERLIWCSRSNW